MSNKILTVAILGCGSRGGDVYGRRIFNRPSEFKITHLCEINKDRLDDIKNRFSVLDENTYTSEEEFFKEKRADLLLICTQDKDHVRECLKALELGYDILLEKPITASREECLSLLAAQEKANRKVIVCHVLRYAPAFIKAKEILDSSVLGRLVTIEAVEQVAYWHQAHSFVRGNWRNSDECVPMILAKCCHDLDYIQYYASSPCTSVSSIGDLTFFKEENAPEGSTKMCIDCKYQDTCPYSAKTLYYTDWVENKGTGWINGVMMRGKERTEENTLKELKTNPYGRCVFRCDNNVVDHQVTQMTFENGVKASLIMTAFTQKGGRIITFYCTYGQLILNEEEGLLKVKPFGKETQLIEISSLVDQGSGHGGGDDCLINSLYGMLNGTSKASTSLKESIESHLMGIAAEESRIQNGKLVYVHK